MPGNQPLNDHEGNFFLSAEQYQTLYNHIPVPIFIWKRIENSFVLIDCNLEAKKISDINISEIIGTKADEIYSDNDINHLLKTLNYCWKNKSKYKKEFSYKEKTTNQKKWIQGTWIFIDPDMIMLLTEDITKRKESEYKLEKSEENYRMIFNNVNDAIVLHDLDNGHILDVNDRMLEMYGYERDQLLQHDIECLSEGVPPYNQEEAIAWTRKAAGGNPQIFEWRAKHKNGKLFWTEVNLKRVTFEDEERLLAVVRDISSRKAREDAIRISEERLKLALDSVSDAVWDWRIDKDEVFFSSRWYLMLGYEPYELSQSYDTWKSLLHPDDLFQTEQNVIETLETGKPFLIEFRLKAKDGQWRWILARGKVVEKDDRGNALRMLGTHMDITERKKMERQLIESETKLKSLFNTVPVGLGILKDRLVLAANEGLSEITGYPINEITGNPSRFLYFSEEEFIAVGKALYENQSNSTNKTYVETRFRHKDGSSRYISLFSAPLNPTDPEAGVAVAVQDITEEKAILQALQESEKRYRSLFNTAGDAIMINKDGFFIDCNQKTLDIFGCKKNEIVGKNLVDISPKSQADGRDSLTAAQIFINQALAGKIVNFEWSHLRPDGTTFEVEVTLSTVELSGNRVVQAIVRDISERKKSEKILRENEFRFRSFFHTNPEGIMLVNFEGRIFDANRAFLKRSGYSLSDFYMESFTILLPEEQQDIVMQSLFNLKRGIRLSDNLHTVYRSKNGELVPVSLRSWVINDEFSNPLYFGIFIHDLTKELKLAEEKVSLERQVIQAQKSEAIGMLANGIAHDFNNILGGIIGFTELALYRDPDSLDEKTKEMLRRVLEGGNRAKGLVQQILRFSRNNDTVMEAVSISSIMKEALLLLQATIPSTITIEKQFLLEGDTVLGDPNQLHQLIMNLATNAYHAMKEEGGVLGVKLENRTLEEAKRFRSMAIPAGDYIKMTIADSGCGMTSAVLEKIFEPYFTTKNINEGTGLGMAVVYGIVKSHKGLIAVKSTPGEGTVFEVYLPSAREDTMQDWQVQPITSRGNGQKILIVDDEPYFLDVVEENLKTLGYQVTACRSSVEAFQVFRESPNGYDLLVTDQTMPELTGVQLIQKMRMIRDNIPVILCTGFSDTVTEQSSRYYGINRFLMKPVSMNDLAGVVLEVLAEA